MASFFEKATSNIAGSFDIIFGSTICIGFRWQPYDYGIEAGAKRENHMEQ